MRMRAETEAVEVGDGVLGYLQEIVALTRTEKKLSLGASPRALLALTRASQAHAYLQGRNFVKPDDVKAVAVWVLHHRVSVSAEARMAGESADDIVRELVRKARLPRE